MEGCAPKRSGTSRDVPSTRRRNRDVLDPSPSFDGLVHRRTGRTGHSEMHHASCCPRASLRSTARSHGGLQCSAEGALLRHPAAIEFAPTTCLSGPSPVSGFHPLPVPRRTARRFPGLAGLSAPPHPRVIPHRSEQSLHGSTSFVLELRVHPPLRLSFDSEPEGPSSSSTPRRARLTPVCSEEQRIWSVLSVRRIPATE